MKRILIIEDDDSIAAIERDYLVLAGFEVDIAATGGDGIAMGRSGHYDLRLLDLMLPGVDGFSVCRTLRGTLDIPILMVTARQEDIDKIKGLGMGADDYITKPFEIEELLARIRAALRKRAPALAAGEGLLTSGKLALDPGRHTVRYGEEEISLTSREFDLLQALMENRSIVLRREQLLSKVWGYDYMGETNVVDVYIRYLRSKIDEKFGVKFIHTVRGVGYVFRDAEA